MALDLDTKGAIFEMTFEPQHEAFWQPTKKVFGKQSLVINFVEGFREVKAQYSDGRNLGVVESTSDTLLLSNCLYGKRVGFVLSVFQSCLASSSRTVFLISWLELVEEISSSALLEWVDSF